jgi:septal ring factor EnvC (AmiA/AmiB activator)
VQIELLWIIPIVAFASFILLVIYLFQKKQNATSPDLNSEVEHYNYGYKKVNRVQPVSEDRLYDLEKAISIVTQSLTNQQKMIDKFQKENTESNAEVNELKVKLRELYKEHDIVLSENYSLRAKVKKLMDGKADPSETSEKEILSEQNLNDNKTGPNLKLYEDTRLMNLMVLDDTTELDLSEAR